MHTQRIVVVGAGPAGMMAAIRASELQQQVTLIEKNPSPGKKLLLSGKGRCNLTNTCDLDYFLRRFSGGGQFLRDAFKKFFYPDLIRFFEDRGLQLKIERQLRVFPASDRSASVLDVLKKALTDNSVEIIYKTALKDIFLRENRVEGVLLSDGKVLPAARIILATGGLSYSFTGSTGEGLALAQKLGHRLVPLRPGLVPLEVKQAYPRHLQGLVLKNIRLKFSDGERQLVSGIGELLFTSFGISGPLVLSLSGQLADRLSQGKRVYLEIDLKPALSTEQLNARLLREFKLSPKKNIRNILKNLLPVKLAQLFAQILRFGAEKNASQLSQQERRDLIALLKGWRLDILSTRPLEEGMVTRGGISLKEINPRTMESRLIKGLYFAGEMMDIDADTGGFNLQAAFSTGYLAGESAALS